jgi:TRAP-type C4-dicarboxylate transport system permease small subunit
MKAIKNLIRISFYASIVPTLILMMLTAVDVVLRYLLNTAIPDIVEVTSFLLAILISLAFAHTTYQRDHVEINIIVERLSPRPKFAAEILTSFIGALLLITMTWQALIKALYSLSVGEFLGGMMIPVYPAKFAFAFSCLLTALAMMLRFYEAICKFIRGEEEPKE